jgi:2,4-dienoyl-CoA reductase-like NADH-dependent reductase (Old Yellow Enzyme family)
MKNDGLFSELRIKNITFRNRLGVAPMTRTSSSSNGMPRRDVLDLLVLRARNGAAIVYTEAIVTDYESAQGYTMSLSDVSGLNVNE